MNRTINEKTAWHYIFSGTISNIFSVILMLYSLKMEFLFAGGLAIFIYIVSMFTIISGYYGLGWEYKRLSMEEERRETKQEGTKE